jgi:hypothetical protein
VQVLRNDLNEGEQLIFAEAETIDLGGALVFVTSGDVDDDGDDDVVAVDEGAGPARVGDPRPPRRGEEGNVSVLLNGLPCPADLDDDGVVNTADLLYLLGCWGTDCGDVDSDGDTDTADLLALLAAWGECP